MYTIIKAVLYLHRNKYNSVLHLFNYYNPPVRLRCLLHQLLVPFINLMLAIVLLLCHT